MTQTRVLVVDDSAFARKVVRELLSRARDIEVIGTARDGLEALEKIAALRPDVVTLDLVMPHLDGLGVLRALPPDGPRVVVVSISGPESELAVEALQRGAVELVTKPSPLATDRLYGLAGELTAKVRAAAAAQPRTSGAPLPIQTPLPRPIASGAARLVVIGTSTGGPQALTRLVPALPDRLPPVAIALHIPAGYTAPLAARLSRLSGFQVEEARDGMELAAGRAVIAPGGMHLRVRKSAGRLSAAVSALPHDSLHRPSVDLLFESAAAAEGDRVVAVVLTGMGNDGLRGAETIRRAGGRVIAESAESCVVYGMPRAVVEAGLADAEAPLARIPEALARLVSGTAARR